MRRQAIFRLSFRLTSKDLDLLWLDADKQLSSISAFVKMVLRGMLQGAQERIPLPEIPQTSLKTKTIGVRFYKNEDEDIVEWLQGIEKGSRGFLVKELLRHAMEAIDYRPYLLTQKGLSFPLEIKIPRQEYQRRNVAPAAPIWTPQASSYDGSMENGMETQNERLLDPSAEEEEDDWLSAFEKMSHQ